MGLLKLFRRATAPQLTHLPSGSFTLDPEGKVMTSTLPVTFPAAYLREIGQVVLQAFRGAKKAQLPLNEIVVQFAALRLLARELRGGAIIFLRPQALDQGTKKPAK